MSAMASVSQNGHASLAGPKMLAKFNGSRQAKKIALAKKNPGEPLILREPGHANHGNCCAELAGRRCVYCQERIGYNVPFFFVSTMSKEVMHEHCHRVANK